MGYCASKHKKKEENQKKVSTDLNELDLVATENDKLIKRTFTVIISNLKIKNPPQKQNVSLQINFDNQVKKVLSLQEQENTLRWKQSFEFEYTVDDYRLKKIAFANISLINNNNQAELGRVYIKLYRVATGPYHHDMTVSWQSQLTAYKIQQMKKLNIPIKEQNEGRVSFDLKMFQQIEFCITPDSITSYLENFTDKAYNFSLKLITQKNTYNSEHSEYFLNPAFQKNDEKQYTESLEEQNSRKSHKKGHKEKENQEENFNADMNENIDIIKMRGKQIKIKEHIESQQSLESPYQKQKHIPYRSDKYIQISQKEKKKNPYIMQKQGYFSSFYYFNYYH